MILYVRRLLLLPLALAAFCAGAATGAWAAGERASYVLGAQDRLMIRVHSIRKNFAEAYSWGPLTGEFTVGPDGFLSLPLIGELDASGRTAADLADAISKALQEKANLAELPSTSVEIVEYRPFFVLGAAQKPGKYEFQPGITVLQALSMAEGLARPTDFATIEREIIVSAGDIRTLDAERNRLEIRLARLNAEVGEAPAISFPREMVSRASDPRIAIAMREETLRFDTRRTALKAEIEAIQRNKEFLQQELKSLDEKGKALDRQIEVNRRDLKSVNDLVARGLAQAPRQLQAENTQVSIENNRLDVQVATVRAQQALATADRDIIDVTGRYQREALDDLALTRGQIEQTTERLKTAEKILANAEAKAPAGQGDLDAQKPIFRITRVTASGPRTSVAAEDEKLQAGDVLLVVIPPQPRTFPSGASVQLGAAVTR